MSQHKLLEFFRIACALAKSCFGDFSVFYSFSWCGSFDLRINVFQVKRDRLCCKLYSACKNIAKQAKQANHVLACLFCVSKA